MSVFQNRVKEYILQEQNSEEILNKRAAFLESASKNLMERIERCLTPTTGRSSVVFTKTRHNMPFWAGSASKDILLTGLEIRVWNRSVDVIPQCLKDGLAIKVSAQKTENVFTMSLGYEETQWVICQPDQEKVFFTDALFDELIAKAMFD